MIQLGIDRLLADDGLRASLRGRRVALLAHPASVTSSRTHSADAVASVPGVALSCLFGPQHGVRGEKQDNMIESEDSVDPALSVPVYSLYGRVRRPTQAMIDEFDLLLIDLQDVGCRVYTFLTTTFYLIEDCVRAGREVWVLDRPNPAGRPVEGPLLGEGWESFVGAAPVALRHGLTLGEAARWFAARNGHSDGLRVVEMAGYDPRRAPGHGWPVGELAWVNPSPNMPTLNVARCYGGTVMLEGTTLSEGRGTTRPLDTVGAPGVDAEGCLRRMRATAPHWLEGAWFRPCHFEPVFHKHAGQLCSGLQFHTDYDGFDESRFRPYRSIALFLKTLKWMDPEYPLWREFEYEYDSERLAIDLINGGPGLREWVDDPTAKPGDLDAMLRPQEQAWNEQRRDFLCYAV